MTLADIIDGIDSREKTVTVLNRDDPPPMVSMLEDMVAAPDVDVVRAEPPDTGPANVVLLEDEDEHQLAVSTIADVGDSVLMVNSDLYVTGTRSIDQVDTPDVLANLDETTFTVEDKQKMLLIEISRHVEALAFRSTGSTLYTGFQQLSRIDDERGTRDVYERLVDAGVDVHAYGVPGGSPDVPDGVTEHAYDVDELRHTWFVVNTDCSPALSAALLAEEVGPNEWTGLWTFDPDIVDRAATYLAETYD